MTKISVIIPTQALKRRGPSLLRAIESVTSLQESPAIPIVVANGADYDPELVECLRSKPEIRFFLRSEGDLAKARHFGRQQVDSPYFGFLDDDDEYLPAALSRRSGRLSADKSIDAIVTNGIRIVLGQEQPYVADMAAVAADPATSLMNKNWLASCGGLFRTDTVGADFFPDDMSHLEWTYTALRLALYRRIEFLDQPTFIVHDTPGSVSKSRAYRDEHPRSIQRIMELDAPADVKRKLRTKLLEAFHYLSERNRSEGRLKAAWGYHLRSLGRAEGLIRYGLYTRRLIRDSLCTHNTSASDATRAP